MPECINHRVDDGCGSTDCCRLSHAFCPKRMMGRRRAGVTGFPVWRFHSSGQKVIHETALKDVTALVVLHLLIKCGPKSHGQSAMNLSFDDHRIDDVAAII